MSYDIRAVRRQAVDLLSEAPTWRLSTRGWSRVGECLAALQAGAEAGDLTALRRATGRLSDLVDVWRAPRSMAEGENEPMPPQLLEAYGVLIRTLEDADGGGSSQDDSDEH
ncbi:CATRA system-associated protein [Kitasatospora brasiliensis]|uniref:CATRA system-associated protein n=1 Tax=Kitasatospora brasiliensis TaxID=3058040 RepID=UPI00292EFB8E|nr:CATRA system-associated protein [Kitasatospora sp. K002]